MARTRVEDNLPAFGSWDDVDQALAVIGDNQRVIEGIEHDMQEAIDNAKMEAGMKAKQYQDTIAKLEKRIMAFAEDHREDMDGKKTKVLNFGSVGFRKSTKIILPKAAAKLEEIIRQLTARGMGDCVIQQAPKIDKDALRKYPAGDIVACGAGVKADDVFWYEPDREKLADS